MTHSPPPRDVVHRLVGSVLGPGRAATALAAVHLAPALMEEREGVSRAELSMALTIILFAELLERVPTAARHVGEVLARGDRVAFDHGALRTIDGPTGLLPSGHAAFARLLEPLGYQVAGEYPLPRLKMTGRAFAHRDLPDQIPQFFVSELHADRLDPPARDAAARVFGTSVDPLGAAELALLAALRAAGGCDREAALAGLPGLVRAFGRHHAAPTLADYELLRAHSAEAAWIATEGNVFNHATGRVADVAALAAALKRRGWPLKDAVEVSASGRVRQTAMLADAVVREFGTEDGRIVEQRVPGSFYEFISRDVDPATGRLDLAFDSGNATGIFAVTRDEGRR